jgi:hypothetical protein
MGEPVDDALAGAPVQIGMRIRVEEHEVGTVTVVMKCGLLWPVRSCLIPLAQV